MSNRAVIGIALGIVLVIAWAFSCVDPQLSSDGSFNDFHHESGGVF